MTAHESLCTKRTRTRPRSRFPAGTLAVKSGTSIRVTAALAATAAAGARANKIAEEEEEEEEPAESYQQYGRS